MRSRYLFFLVCALLGALPVSALDRNAFTFTNYDLQVRIEPEQHRFAARGKITLRNDSEAPQSAAALQISSSLGWRSVRSGEKSLEFVPQKYTSDIDHTGALSEAIVTLEKPVPPKESVQLEIGYEGVIVEDATRLTRIGTPKEAALHSDWDQIGENFAAVRGVGYVAWYPVALESAALSDGNAMFAALGQWRSRHEKTQFRVSFEIPQNDNFLSAVCNGEESREEVPISCSYTPLGMTVPVFAIASFQRHESEKASILVLPEHDLQASVYSNAVKDALLIVEDWFEEPKKTFKVVDLGDPQAAPYESGSLLLTPLGKNDPKLAQVLIVHQLTHSAFKSPRLWMYEGLAHFSQALMREHQANRQAALDYLGLHRSALLEVEQNKGGGQGLINASDEVLYHSKAALVWWMLRDQVGDRALKAAIRNYKPEEDKDNSYFENVLQKESKRDLSWFFHDWVYTDAGLPDFRIETAATRLTSGTNYVTAITVENTGSAGAEVPITVRTATGDTTQKIEVKAKSKAVTRVTTNGKPVEVVVNDGSVPESEGKNNTYSFETP